MTVRIFFPTSFVCISIFLHNCQNDAIQHKSSTISILLQCLNTVQQELHSMPDYYGSIMNATTFLILLEGIKKKYVSQNGFTLLLPVAMCFVG